MTQQSKEIDFIDLIGRFYFTLKRNKYILLIFLVLGVSAGIYFSTKTKPYYETEMVVKSPLESKVITNQLNTLSDLKNKKNYGFLAKELNLKEHQAKQIKALSINHIEEKKNKEEIEKPYKTTFIRIHLEIYDNDLISKVKKGIFDFSRANSFIQNALESREEHYKEYLERINEALTILREKEAKKTAHQSSKHILLSDESYSSQIIQLMDKKEQIKTKMIENKALVVIKDFYKQEKSKEEVSLRIIFYTLVGIILGIIVVFFIELIKKLERQQTK